MKTTSNTYVIYVLNGPRPERILTTAASVDEAFDKARMITELEGVDTAVDVLTQKGGRRGNRERRL